MSILTEGDFQLESEWGEYLILCADGEVRHSAPMASRRDKAMSVVDRADSEKGCGPHALRQRTCRKLATPWGPLLETDPQTASHEALQRAARSVPCPKCREEVGQPCIDLRVWRYQQTKQPTAWPHAERLEAVMLSTAPCGRCGDVGPKGQACTRCNP